MSKDKDYSIDSMSQLEAFEDYVVIERVESVVRMGSVELVHAEAVTRPQQQRAKQKENMVFKVVMTGPDCKRAKEGVAYILRPEAENETMTFLHIGGETKFFLREKHLGPIVEPTRLSKLQHRASLQ